MTDQPRPHGAPARGTRTRREAPRRTERRAQRPRAESLEPRVNMSGLVVGAAPGGAPLVQVLNQRSAGVQSFLAYAKNFRGGVNVAQGDITGDGLDETITAQASRGGEVKVFDGGTRQQIASFNPFGKAYRGGVNIAYGHFGQQVGQLVVSKAQGRSLVKVIDPTKGTLTSQFRPYGRGTSGAQVAVTNLDQSSATEIATAPGRGGLPMVMGFDARSGKALYAFQAEDASYRGGIEMTAGDFNGDLIQDLATAPDGRGTPRVRLWTRGVDAAPAMISEFSVASKPTRGGLALGTIVQTDVEPDLVAVATIGGRRGAQAVSARGPRVSPAAAAGVAIQVRDQAGKLLQTTSVNSVGAGDFDASSGQDDFNPAYDGPKNIHAFDYSPTWPFWSPKPDGFDTPAQIKVTQRTSDTQFAFTTVTDGLAWGTDMLNNNVLFINSNPQQWYFIASSTFTPSADGKSGSGTITIGPTPDGYSPPNSPDNLPTLDPSVQQGTQLQFQNFQLRDTDFYNSAFQAIWDTPRYNNGTADRTDLQVMQDAGFNTIRLYDWNPVRGFAPDGSGSSDHLAFLDAALAHGQKVIIPISNYNIQVGDGQLWAGTSAPDDQYSLNGGGATPAIVQQLRYFIKSVTTADGKLHPAVAGFSIGNEMDLDAGGTTDAQITAVTKRVLWWTINLQRELQKAGLINPTDPNRPRFMIPVSNGDQGPTDSGPHTSWFQVFRNGASASDPTPHRGSNTSFTTAVNGLVKIVGKQWYQTWFLNAYQTFQRGGGLQQLMQLYDTGGSRSGPWNTSQWPGQKFDVPMVFTELGWSVAEAGSEANYFTAVTTNQAQVAETFLRGQQSSSSPSFVGWAEFEFNQEPYKNGTIFNPNGDSEQTRGVFKYNASSNLADGNKGTIISQAASSMLTVPFKQFLLHWVNVPVYRLFPITSDGTPTGTRLIDKLSSIIKAPGAPPAQVTAAAPTTKRALVAQARTQYAAASPQGPAALRRLTAANGPKRRRG